MLRERWQGCVFLLAVLLSNASGTSPSDFAKIVQSKQSKQARICGGADHRLLRSLANTGEEVMLTIPNEQLQHIAEFREEAELWVATNVVRFLPATRITHVLAGSEVLTSSSGDAYSLVPAMLNLHAALVAAGLDGSVRVSTAVTVPPCQRAKNSNKTPGSQETTTATVRRTLRKTKPNTRYTGSSWTQ